MDTNSVSIPKSVRFVIPLSEVDTCLFFNFSHDCFRDIFTRINGSAWSDQQENYANANQEASKCA